MLASGGPAMITSSIGMNPSIYPPHAFCGDAGSTGAAESNHKRNLRRSRGRIVYRRRVQVQEKAVGVEEGI